MTLTTRRRCLLGMLLTAALTTGCNPFQLASVYMMMTGDHKIPPECKIASDDKDKEVKVVILAYSNLETRPEFLRVDYELSSLMAKLIQDSAKEDKQKITVITASKVQKYKDDHPNWQAIGAAEIGKHFGADYVIDVAIESIGLYEPNSRNQLFRGHTEISLACIDVQHPDDDPIFRKEYTKEYPRTRGPIPVDGSTTSATQFRQAFLNHIATDLAWCFVGRPIPIDSYRDD